MKKNLYLVMILWVGLINSQTFSGGTGTELSPYQIGTVQDLLDLSVLDVTEAEKYWDKHYILTSNIDFGNDSSLIDWNNDGTVDWNSLDTLGFSPIGDNPLSKNTTMYIESGLRQQIPFTGTFNGKGYTISGLYICRYRNEYARRFIGLFGAVHKADIDSLCIDKSIIRMDAGYFIAPLAGYSYDSNIQNSCVINSKISIENADYYSSCFVGKASDSNIKNSYVNSTQFKGKTSNSNNGGFIGQVFFTNIKNCYSTASLKGLSKAGGFIGYSLGSDYHPVENCYLDTIAANRQDENCIPLHSEQFKYKESFENWDFDSTWAIGYISKDNRISPKLRWQDFTPVFNVVYYDGTDIAFVDSLGPYDSNDNVFVKSENHLNKDNLAFKCWNTKENGSGTNVFPSSEFNIIKDVNLYAQWTIDDISVLSFSNFSIQSFSPTCFGRKDGRIMIKSKMLGFDVKIEGDENEYQLLPGDSILIDNLESNSYNLSISVDDNVRNFIVEVPSLSELKSSALIQGNSILLNIEGGKAPYQVQINNNIYTTETGRLTINHLKSDTYSAIIADKSNCTDDVILNFDFERFSIYPNPVENGMLNIILPSSLEGESCKVSILTMDGNIVIIKNEILRNTLCVDVSTLNANTYIVKINSANYKNNTQFIVKK